MERNGDGEFDLSEDGERDLSEERCAFHDEEAAEFECDRCGRAICDRCICFLEHKRICPDCARSRGRFRSVKRVLMATAFVALVGTAVTFFARSMHTFSGLKDDDPFDYGHYKQVVEKQREHLTREPCDRRVITKHAETLLDVGNYRRLVTRADRFFAKCGPHPLLRRNTYVAHKRLSEWDRAIEDATILIEETPDGHDFWWWRGEAYEHAGRLEEAAADYRQALKIEPRLESTSVALASVLERLGRPCEAVHVLEQSLVHHPEDHGEPRIESRIRQLREAGRCKAKRGNIAKPRSRPGKAATR